MKLLATMFFFCVATIAFGQKSELIIIDGFVLDARDSTAIASAIVTNVSKGLKITTKNNGYFFINAQKNDLISITSSGYKEYKFKAIPSLSGRIYLNPTDNDTEKPHLARDHEVVINRKILSPAPAPLPPPPVPLSPAQSESTYDFSPINENKFNIVCQEPLSTFSIDVDKASYSISRHFITSGRKPPIDAVRLEEFINYFPYDYQDPQQNRDIRIQTELTNCPWNKRALLLKIGLKSKKVSLKNGPANNVVFLIDISGSMDAKVKLPLAKKAYTLLLNKLRDDDFVSIVTYGGSSTNIVMEPTICSDRRYIAQQLQNLQPGGGTPGGPGIEVSYNLLKRNLSKFTNNRVIVATDGDFNMGTNSDSELQRMMESLRRNNIEITVMGFGIDNLKDNKLEIIADKGNGNYYHIDNVIEAKKVLVEEFRGTLITVAKDVKAQVEFNPSQVSSYRQIGYENRYMRDADFDDSKIDAGEMGSGHTVTALYEINVDACSSTKSKKYRFPVTSYNSDSNQELLTINLKYKNPSTDIETKLEEVVFNNPKSLQDISDDFRFICSVAQFGMLLRDSPLKGDSSWEQARSLGYAGLGEDEDGYRGEYLKLLDEAKFLQY